MPGGRSAGLGISTPQVQRLRRLLGDRRARRAEQAFVVEGPTLISEAVAAGCSIEVQYGAPGVDPVDAAGPAHVLATGVAERIADTQSPSGLFAVVAQRSGPVELLAEVGFVLVAHGVTDPGNLGTMLRTAEAAGIDAVVVTPGTVDPHNPKVVRSSAGSLFHLPVVEAGLADVAAAGLRTVATSSHRGIPHTAADWSGRLAIVAGSEAHGLPDDVAVDDWVRIEHAGRAESLNVAMAVAIVCFEAARARGIPPGSVPRAPHTLGGPGEETPLDR